MLAYVHANVDYTGVFPWDMTSFINGTIRGSMQNFATNFTYSQGFITVTQTKCTPTWLCEL